MRAAGLLLLILFASCGGPRPPVTLPRRTPQAIPVMIHNPYGLSADLELKCGELRIWRALPAKGSAVLWIPAQATQCEIWPKIRFFGR